MTTLVSEGNSFVSNREKEALISLLEKEIGSLVLRDKLSDLFSAPELELNTIVDSELVTLNAVLGRLHPSLSEDEFDKSISVVWQWWMDKCHYAGKSLYQSAIQKKLALETFNYIQEMSWVEMKKTASPHTNSRFLSKCFLSSILLMSLGACSFKSSPDSKKKSGDVVTFGEVVTRLTDDSDGDKVTDGEEFQRGTNPMVADIPEIKVRFLQDYSISFSAEDNTEGDELYISNRIDTQRGRINPDFKYRVGEVMLRGRSFQTAAEIGKFASHSWGTIKQQDLTWVNYPQIDPAFYHAESLRVRPYFAQGYDITDVSVKLENSFKLVENSRFKEIKNLTLAFRYYDYEKESFVLLHEQKIERVLQAGVLENISIEINNIPKNLLIDNYLKKGEFIISEIVDYDIPELGTNYKTLLASVKAKSIPVLVTTPLETKISYVGLPSRPARFQEILSRLYDNKFTIEENELKKIDQFESNLADYTYLKEVKDKDKQGKWFVFTNQLVRHYLEHGFTNKDVISLSYVSGKDLASQVEEKVHAYYPEATGNNEFVVYPLGNISVNSEIDIQLDSAWRTGDKLKNIKDEYHSSGAGCRGNCSTSDTHCSWDINIFETRDEGYTLQKDLTGEIEQLSLVVNRSEYPIKDLIEKKLVTVTWVEDSLNLNIRDINTIQELNASEENMLQLKVSTFKGETFNGIKLVSMTGKQYYYCPRNTLAIAFGNKIPVSDESLEFPTWRQSGNWNVLTIGTRKTYSEPFTIQVSSSIKNFHN